MPTENNIQIEGHRNIIIQNAELHNVQIQTIDEDAFEEILKKAIASKDNPLHIFVLATLSMFLRTEIENGQIPNNVLSYIQTYYGEEYSAWRPFAGQSSILEMLKEYQEKSGFRLKVFILDFGNRTDIRTLMHRLKLRKSRTVLIVDGLALHFVGNQKVAQVFDDNEIGGCLIPLCKQSDTNIKNLIQQTVNYNFPSLQSYVQHYADEYLQERIDNGFVHIDLEISDKNMLFRRLTHIATLHLRPQPSRRYADLDDIGEVPSL